MVYTLRNRNVLITGGSRGLGAVTATRFAAEGANVVVNYVANAAAADELAGKLAGEYGVKAVAIQGDVSTATECQRLVTGTLAALGGLDIIISNAGWTRISPFGDISALTDADWDKTFAVNVKANAHLLTAASTTFAANADGGVLIITSSCAATNVGGSSMAYAVSKAAQLHLMRCLAATQGPKVRVNAILPGLLLTEWGRLFGEDVITKSQDNAALGRLATLEDCANAFLYLAKADSVTGAAIRIDGGQFQH